MGPQGEFASTWCLPTAVLYKDYIYWKYLEILRVESEKSGVWGSGIQHHRFHLWVQPFSPGDLISITWRSVVILEDLHPSFGGGYPTWPRLCWICNKWVWYLWVRVDKNPGQPGLNSCAAKDSHLVIRSPYNFSDLHKEPNYSLMKVSNI